MQKNIENYFTTGELSQLCKIPRKTLLYYDKLGLITPELIDENGYRYYTRSQLFLLQLILTLRQLNIPIAQIKEYLTNRSLYNYDMLFNERIKHFKQEVIRLQQLITQLEYAVNSLDEVRSLELNKITLKTCGEEYLFISDKAIPSKNFKNRSTYIANMFAELEKNVPLTSNSFGYIYNTEILKNFSTKHLCHYFYTLNQALNSPHCYKKTAGIYLTLYFQGVYMFNNKKYLQLLANYLTKNNFTPISPIYITSLSDYWTTNDMSKYIYKMEVRVK